MMLDWQRTVSQTKFENNENKSCGAILSQNDNGNKNHLKFVESNTTWRAKSPY